MIKRDEIETFKQRAIKMLNDDSEGFSAETIYTIICECENQLNQIEQQKEIQDLVRIINKQLKEIADLKEKNKVVSKDKIREKIEHYNNELEHIKKGEEFENEEPMYYWGKVALEKLLEEK